MTGDRLQVWKDRQIEAFATFSGAVTVAINMLDPASCWHTDDPAQVRAVLCRAAQDLDDARQRANAEFAAARVA